MSAMTDAGRRGRDAHRAADGCAHRPRAAGAHGGRRSPGLCGALDPLRRHRQGQPGHPRRHVRAVRLSRRSWHSATPSIRRSRWRSCAPGSRSFRPPTGPITCWRWRMSALALWIAWRLVGAFSRRREARGRARAAHAGAVLQFPRAEVQLQHGAACRCGRRPRCGSCARSRPAACSMRRSPGCSRRSAMYGKYWSVFLLLGLGIAALADPRRARLFPLARPWVTIAVGALVLAPHVAWLIANDFAPFSYARRHARRRRRSHRPCARALGYLAGSVAYVALPLIIVLARGAAEPRRRQGHGVAGSARAPARGGCVLGRAAGAGAWSRRSTGFRLTSLWSMSAWTLLPVMLLSSPLVAHRPPRRHRRRRARGRIFPFVMVAAAPAIAFGASPRGPAARLRAFRRSWRSRSSGCGARPATGRCKAVRRLGGIHRRRRVLSAAAIRVPTHARRTMACAALDAAHRPRRHRPALSRASRAIACGATGASTPPSRSADRFPAGKRTEIEVARRYLGVEGKPARYLVITIPPKQ